MNYEFEFYNVKKFVLFYSCNMMLMKIYFIRVELEIFEQGKVNIVLEVSGLCM